jgi:hypothetical protein
LRRNYSRFIHGQVQAKLLAISFKTENSPDFGAKEIVELVDEIEALNAALMTVQSQERDSFSLEFERIVAGWAGVLTVDVRSNPEFPTGFQNDFTAQECALEVIQEAFSNAAKYSDSNVVEVSFALDQTKNLRIEVENTFDSYSDQIIAPSLGSKIFDELTTSWQRDFNGKQVKLIAVINVR